MRNRSEGLVYSPAGRAFVPKKRLVSPDSIPVDVVRLYEVYVREEKTQRDTGRELGISGAKVREALAIAGFPIRTRGQAVKIGWGNQERKNALLAKIQSEHARAKRVASRKDYFDKHPEAYAAMIAAIKKARVKKQLDRLREKFGPDIRSGLEHMFVAEGKSPSEIARETGLPKHAINHLLAEHGFRESGQLTAYKTERVKTAVDEARAHGAFDGLSEKYKDVLAQRAPLTGQPATLETIARKLGLSRRDVQTIQDAALLFLELSLHEKGLLVPDTSQDEPAYQISPLSPKATLDSLYFLWGLTVNELTRCLGARPEVVTCLMRDLGMRLRRARRSRLEEKTAKEYLSRLNP